MSGSFFVEGLDDFDVRRHVEERRILELSLAIREKYGRENFWVSYAEQPESWRRVTVTCDYSNAPEDWLESDLLSMPDQRDRSAHIYASLRDSSTSIHFYDTVTNLKLKTLDGQIHVNVTEDVNEITGCPSPTFSDWQTTRTADPTLENGNRCVYGRDAARERQHSTRDMRTADPSVRAGFEQSNRSKSSDVVDELTLVAEVKGICHGLAIVESKCIALTCEHDAAMRDANAGAETGCDVESFQALLALHRRLLQEHHDFFLSSQHPAASRAIRNLAARYSISARMWKHGFHNFLELFIHRLAEPSSLDLMLAFTYLSFQMMALLVETVPSFEETWLECLGDLARYRMAIEEENSSACETWTGVARYWYMKAGQKSPKPASLYKILREQDGWTGVSLLRYLSRWPEVPYTHSGHGRMEHVVLKRRFNTRAKANNITITQQSSEWQGALRSKATRPTAVGQSSHSDSQGKSKTESVDRIQQLWQSLGRWMVLCRPGPMDRSKYHQRLAVSQRLLTYAALTVLISPTAAATPGSSIINPTFSSIAFLAAISIALATSVALPAVGIVMGVAAWAWVVIHDQPSQSMFEPHSSVEIFVVWATAASAFVIMHCIRLQHGRCRSSSSTWTPAEAYLPLTLLGSIPFLGVLANCWPGASTEPKGFLAVGLPPAFSLSSLFWALFGARWSSRAEDLPVEEGVELHEMA